jgi:hypothetical protein
MNVILAEEQQTHHGKKDVKAAVVILNGKRFSLGLGDTHRCAHMPDAAERTLKNLAKQAGDDDYEPNGEAVKLHAHCRKLIGIKEDPQ